MFLGPGSLSDNFSIFFYATDVDLSSSFFLHFCSDLDYWPPELKSTPCTLF